MYLAHHEQESINLLPILFFLCLWHSCMYLKLCHEVASQAAVTCPARHSFAAATVTTLSTAQIALAAVHLKATTPLVSLNTHLLL